MRSGRPLPPVADGVVRHAGPRVRPAAAVRAGQRHLRHAVPGLRVRRPGGASPHGSVYPGAPPAPIWASPTERLLDNVTVSQAPDGFRRELGCRGTLARLAGRVQPSHFIGSERLDCRPAAFNCFSNEQVDTTLCGWIAFGNCRTRPQPIYQIKSPKE